MCLIDTLKDLQHRFSNCDFWKLKNINEINDILNNNISDDLVDFSFNVMNSGGLGTIKLSQNKDSECYQRWNNPVKITESFKDSSVKKISWVQNCIISLLNHTTNKLSLKTI